ncbi:FRG domain-containing protein [Marinilactibacillus sp. GCM10026970]|uniref:FRG domain-containing protein n=1 Tax=Marinilactibacillus sp. GCM10026970 TaxID=3252642 RepID=UPI003623BD9F
MLYEVNSVSQYIDLIKKLQEESDYPLYYRGQSKFYDKMDSTAFRMDLLEKGSLHQGYPFKRIIKDFKYEVWNDINNDTRKRFLAFCQHHGIPTNLLDFTENPLIALYFAVSNQENMTTPGYIHILNTPLLDMTDFIEEYAIDEGSIFELTFSDDLNILEKIIHKFRYFEENHPKEFYRRFKRLNNDLQHFKQMKNREILYDSTEIMTIEDEIFSEIECINQENKYSIHVPIYDNMMRKDIEKTIFNNSPNHNVTAYLLYLRYFRVLLNLESKWPKYINGLLPMTYKPILNFKRGINQKGIFIYQNYFERIPSKSHGYREYTVQSIESNHIIKITDSKFNIGEMLDLLQINKKFVYGDFESTASYFVNKYNRF